MKPLWKVKGSFNRTSWKVSDVRIFRYVWVLSSLAGWLSVCLFVCLSVCLSVRVCVSVSVRGCGARVCGARGCGGGGGGGRWRGEGERLIEPSGPKFPSRLLKLQSFSRANDCWNRGHAVLNLFSNMKMRKIEKFLSWTTEARDHQTWANSGK